MTVRNYEELKTAIKRKLEIFSQEIEQYLPTAIFLAEERVAREAGYDRLNVVETYKVNLENDRREEPIIYTSPDGSVYGGPSANLEIYKVSTEIDPDNFLFFNNVYALIFPNVEVKLVRTDESFISEYNNRVTTVQNPKYYSYQEGNPSNILIAPTSSATIDDGLLEGVKVDYAKKPDKLSSSNPVNVLINKVPDLLMAAAVIEIAVYSKMTSQLGMYQNQYNELLLSHLITSGKEIKDIARAQMNNTTNTQKVNLNA